MPAIDDVLYVYDSSAGQAAVEAVTVDGQRVQGLSAGAALRPIDPDTDTTIPLDELRSTVGGVLDEYPTTNDDGEWAFAVVGYPTIKLGVTPEGGSEKEFGGIFSPTAIIAAIVNGGGAAAVAGQALVVAGNALVAAQAAQAAAASGGTGIEQIVQVSPGVYPAPLGSAVRWFYGEIEPTEAQGYRNGDTWWHMVIA